jgi:hypothetical protein
MRQRVFTMVAYGPGEDVTTPLLRRFVVYNPSFYKGDKHQTRSADEAWLVSSPTRGGCYGSFSVAGSSRDLHNP